MKKYFIISDVHSYFTEMKAALDEAGFDVNNPEHMLISCGDLFDRGPDSLHMINFMLGLYYENRAILVKGNHEDLMEEAINRGYFKIHDIHNKTHITVCALTGKEDPDEALQLMPENDLWNRYINACIDFYETPKHIFVHGWIPVGFKYDDDERWHDLPLAYRPVEKVYSPDWRKPVWYEDWKEARWANGMAMWEQGIKEPGKTIVCGHVHTSWGHANLHGDGKEYLNSVETFYIDPDTGKQEPHANFDIFYDDGIIAIDACTALTHKVNVLIIDEENI